MTSAEMEATRDQLAPSHHVMMGMGVCGVKVASTLLFLVSNNNSIVKALSGRKLHSHPECLRRSSSGILELFNQQGLLICGFQERRDL